MDATALTVEFRLKRSPKVFWEGVENLLMDKFPEEAIAIGEGLGNLYWDRVDGGTEDAGFVLWRSEGREELRQTTRTLPVVTQPGRPIYVRLIGLSAEDDIPNAVVFEVTPCDDSECKVVGKCINSALLPAFRTVLGKIADLWEESRESISAYLQPGDKPAAGAEADGGEAPATEERPQEAIRETFTTDADPCREQFTLYAPVGTILGAVVEYQRTHPKHFATEDGLIHLRVFADPPNALRIGEARIHGWREDPGHHEREEDYPPPDFPRLIRFSVFEVREPVAQVTGWCHPYGRERYAALRAYLVGEYGKPREAPRVGAGGDEAPAAEGRPQEAGTSLVVSVDVPPPESEGSESGASGPQEAQPTNVGGSAKKAPRVPSRAPEFRQWVETWRAVERPWKSRKNPRTGKAMKDTYKELADTLTGSKPELHCSTRTLADIIKAGEAGLLNEMPGPR